MCFVIGLSRTTFSSSQTQNLNYKQSRLAHIPFPAPCVNLTIWSSIDWFTRLSVSFLIGQCLLQQSIENRSKYQLDKKVILIRPLSPVKWMNENESGNFPGAYSPGSCSPRACKTRVKKIVDRRRLSFFALYPNRRPVQRLFFLRDFKAVVCF